MNHLENLKSHITYKFHPHLNDFCCYLYECGETTSSMTVMHVRKRFHISAQNDFALDECTLFQLIAVQFSPGAMVGFFPFATASRPALGPT